MAISRRHLRPVVPPVLHLHPCAACLVALLLAACVPALAQSTSDTDSSDDDSASARHFSFTIYQAGGESPTDICYENPQHQVQPLVFNEHARSDVYQYKGPPKVEFFRLLPPVKPGAPPTRELAASVTVPDEGDQFLFLFLPSVFAQQNGLPAVYALDDSPAAFPFGTVRLFNATKDRLAGLVGDTRLPVMPGTSIPVVASKNGTMIVALAIYYEGKSRLSYGNNVHVRRRARTLLILLPSLRPGSIQVSLQSLEEFPAKLATPGTTPAPTTNSVAQTN